MKKFILIAVITLAGLVAAAHQAGLLEAYRKTPAEQRVAAKAAGKTAETPAPAVSVIEAAEADFVGTVLVTGSFAAREEILVAPEVDGLRVLELRAEEGDSVKKGDILAILVTDQLKAQVDANEAALVSATAGIGRARNQISEMEARVKEAEAQLERARPLVQSKYLSQSIFDQREAAARSAEAQLESAKGALAQAEAEKGQVEAQRRELEWRLGRAEVRAPADGFISKRAGRIGGIATASSLAGGDTMFRIVQNGEIELDAEVAETHLWKVEAGQKARVTTPSGKEIEGTVRLVGQEVDKATRLGRVRISLGVQPGLKVGSFGRGVIETGRSREIAVPLSAVLYSGEGTSVQVVVDGKIVTSRVKTGHETAGLIAISSGLKAGDLVVAKAGTFLREGDAVRPVKPDALISSGRRDEATR